MRFTLESSQKGGEYYFGNRKCTSVILTDVIFNSHELGTVQECYQYVPLLNVWWTFWNRGRGSAPKHVQSAIEKKPYQWIPGEYWSLVPFQFEMIWRKKQYKKASILAKTLTKQYGNILRMQGIPSRKVMNWQTGASSFYLSLYWAQIFGSTKWWLGIKRRFRKSCKSNWQMNQRFNQDLLPLRETLPILALLFPDDIKWTK